MTNENILIILSIVFLTSLVIYKFLPTTVNVVGSRQAMETAMQIVREDKPTPVQSSRFYAVVASEYFETTKSSIGNRVYDYRIVEFSTTTLRNVLTQIVDEDNANSEGFIMKVGPEYWDQTKGWTKEDKRPFSPQAVKMTSFIIDDNFTYQVPPPPVYGSEEFKAGLAQVKSAAERRTPEQGVLINFWGGVPGTEGPAGIWQNKLYDVTKKYHLSDQLYAYVQMILAKSVADSFRECWKTKFTYQTKRPDMTDSTIPLAMPDPSFPSYVSGHSTVSFAAATVLSKLFPADSEQFFSDATAAKNSRLHAGIHFPYDNDEGEKLGRAIGEFTIGKLNLKKIK